MARKKVDYTSKGVGNLPNDKPAVYRIETEGGKTNYVGSAKRGRVPDRIMEHQGEIPGAVVKVQQFDTIKEAQANEQRVIKREQPKYNEKGK